MSIHKCQSVEILVVDNQVELLYNNERGVAVTDEIKWVWLTIIII